MAGLNRAINAGSTFCGAHLSPKGLGVHESGSSPLFQKGRVLAQDGLRTVNISMAAISSLWLRKKAIHRFSWSERKSLISWAGQF